MSNTGCCSCFTMKEGVNLVCNRDIMTCSLLDFLKAGLHSIKVVSIWKSLLWMLLFQHYCHFVWRSLLILGFRSVYGILNSAGVRSKADLVAESALSFPLTTMWLGIQHKYFFTISLLFDIQSSLLKSLIISGGGLKYFNMIVRLRIW